MPASQRIVISDPAGTLARVPHRSRAGCVMSGSFTLPLQERQVNA
jgi:hypothetical protein